MYCLQNVKAETLGATWSADTARYGGRSV